MVLSEVRVTIKSADALSALSLLSHHLSDHTSNTKVREKKKRI
jgi:hypothetical protein